MQVRRWQIGVAAVVAALATVSSRGAAWAAEGPRFEASISTDTMGLDETLRLVVTLDRDAAQSYQGYTRPDVRDFDILSQAESESTQWTVTGAKQITRTLEQHIYLLRAKHKGTCTIPPAVVRVDGHELKTRELVVRVNPPQKKVPGQPSPTAPMPGQPGQPADPAGMTSPFQSQPEPEGMRGDEDIFIEARADRTSVHVGEQLVVTWTLYTRTQLLQFRTTVEPKHDDFWSEDLQPLPQRVGWEQRTVKGQSYQAMVLLKRALFPLRSGKLQVTALEAEATTLQTAFYAGGSAVRPSKAITVEVLPLPAKDQPEGFEPANVGHYELVAYVDKQQVKAGDSLTYRLTLRGRGNVRQVKPPRLDALAGKLDGFKVYEPTMSESVVRGPSVEGTKTYTYLLLPRKGGALEIPALSMPYFDPDEKKYLLAETTPITITVDGDPQKIGAPGSEASKENVLGPRIKPLRNSHHVSTRVGELVLRGPILPIAIAAPPTLLLMTMFGGAVRARLRRETARSKRRRARAAARRRMRTAELHIKGQRPSAFFGECARAIYEHLEYRLGTKCESYTMEELRRLLVERGFDEDLAKGTAAELESCDYARFAPSAQGPGEMKSAIRRVRGLLNAIESVRVRGGSEEAAA